MGFDTFGGISFTRTLASLFGMKVAHPDGHPMLYLNWPMIRTIDLKLHLAAPYGKVTIHVVKGRVHKFVAEQESLWAGGDLTAA